MKRSHSHVAPDLTILPDAIKADKQVFKTVLEGSHRLRVNSVVDISKPSHKPVDEIEEPEEEDKALQNRLNKSNARLLQLHLEDSAKNQIKAIETEVIKSLSSVQKNWVITIQGPVEVRCGNIMLEAKNISKVEEVNSEDIDEIEQVKRQEVEVAPALDQASPEDILDIKNIPLVDLDGDFDDDDDCIILER